MFNSLSGIKQIQHSIPIKSFTFFLILYLHKNKKETVKIVLIDSLQATVSIDSENFYKRKKLEVEEISSKVNGIKCTCTIKRKSTTPTKVYDACLHWTKFFFKFCLFSK